MFPCHYFDISGSKVYSRRMCSVRLYNVTFMTTLLERNWMLNLFVDSSGKKHVDSMLFYSKCWNVSAVSSLGVMLDLPGDNIEYSLQLWKTILCSLHLQAFSFQLWAALLSSVNCTGMLKLQLAHWVVCLLQYSLHVAPGLLFLNFLLCTLFFCDVLACTDKCSGL